MIIDTKRNRLRELRDRSRLTMQEVSILTGFTVPTISRHENGTRSLSADAMAKYAALYKVQTHELYMRNPEEGEEDEKDL
jgi:transcriptional regulator with XRE-family HTH domain